ncbi:DNA ligase [Thalassotalea atypica]|uniref:DNA ligase n=1 Tax=Thalassotalea atypica TaxID=2054316 RepID=UPI002572D7B3|nr:DNA ligase [Thalassotalea atypica]
MKPRPLFYLILVCVLLSITPLKAIKLPIQLATPYKESAKIEEHYISEKLDGIRGYWTGKQLLTRSGKVISAPDFFTKNWPMMPMEGELWSARGEFQTIMSIVRKKSPIAQEWQTIRFMIFDLPQHTGLFEQRFAAMTRVVKTTDSPYLQLIEQISVESNTQLHAYYRNIIKNGGEGVMLHHKQSLYKSGRTQQLMKLKPFIDADATVIKHFGGKGKYVGMLGSILVKTPEGISFKIGSGFSDQERKNPPPIGAIVSYKYSGKTNAGVPKFASYLRIKQLAQE